MGYHDARSLLDRGIELPVPEAVHIRDDVDLDRIAPGAVLHPGSRLAGAGTLIAAGAEVGTRGPAVLDDVALGPGASVASGTAESCTLLAGAALGPDSQVRAGTLLEEEASTGHAVGLKQTILLSFATLGSLINFCDCLLAGGTSRKDHSEVGSGFIHFNFTPFGARGDKATASLFGDVARGVFLRESRIFLGGSGGIVGPVRVDYGTVLAAGSVYRRDYESGRLVYGEKPIARSVSFDPMLVRGARRRASRCVRYVGELRALEAWYRDLRLARAGDPIGRALVERGLHCIASGIAERIKQIDRFLEGAGAGDDPRDREDLDAARRDWEGARPVIEAGPKEIDEAAREAFLKDLDPSSDHLDLVRGISPERVSAGRRWLASIVDSVAARYPEP